MKKQRLSVSVDADLVQAAEAAVAAGRIETVSAWVNDALRLKLEHDRRLLGLAEYIREYESEHGTITQEEMRSAARRARARAIPVRGPAQKRTPRSRRGGGAR